MKKFTLESKQTFSVPLEEVFEFFSKAENLGVLTPGWMEFKILTPLPIQMKPGAVIDYRISMRGLPMRWRTVIEEWDPPHRFVDVQARGPYRYWRHEHSFVEREGQTEVIDRVEYAPPGGALVNALIVKGQLRQIFQYRQGALVGVLGPSVAQSLGVR